MPTRTICSLAYRMSPFRTIRPDGTNVEAHDRFFTSAQELSLQPSCETILHDTMLIVHDRTTGSNSRPRQLLCYIIYLFSTPLKLLQRRLGKLDGPTVVVNIDLCLFGRRQYPAYVYRISHTGRAETKEAGTRNLPVGAT
jgi:hypothetical protein